MNIYAQAALEIIKQQEAIIGPVALDQAKRVKTIKISESNEVTIIGDGKSALNELVQEYSKIFGKASIEVCKDAIREIEPPIPTDNLPDILH
jgi:hypothetical protein